MSVISNLRMTTTICGILAVFASGSSVARAAYVFGAPTKVPNVSMPGTARARISADGLELYFARGTPCTDLWVARRSTRAQSWDTPVRLDPPVNYPGPIALGSPSADGLELYFDDGYPPLLLRQGQGCVVNPNGYGNGDLWVSKRAARSEPWGEPQNLGLVVNTPSFEGYPHVSADGLSLYFASNRPGGYGYIDLYMTSRRSTADPWGPPVNLGPPVNTSHGESFPFLSPDRLSLYYTAGDLQSDIYVSTRTTTDGPWGMPKPLTPVNSPLSDSCLCFAAQDTTLYFMQVSDVFNPMSYDVWQVEVFPIVDFNGDALLDLTDLVMLIENWGTNDVLYDIGPMPLGDGKVDIEDLKVFMAEWEKENQPAQP